MANQAHIWTQRLNGIVLTHSTSSKDLKCTGLTDEFSSQLIKIWLYTKKSNFDFLVKIKYQRSQFIIACKNMKLIHQETKNSRFHFEKSKFLNLEIFLSVGNFFFLSQLWAKFPPRFQRKLRTWKLYIWMRSKTF